MVQWAQRTRPSHSRKDYRRNSAAVVETAPRRAGRQDMKPAHKPDME